MQKVQKNQSSVSVVAYFSSKFLSLFIEKSIFIALDKTFFVVVFLSKSIGIFFFVAKTYVMGTHLKRLIEALLMSIHNVCFVEK